MFACDQQYRYPADTEPTITSVSTEREFFMLIQSLHLFVLGLRVIARYVHATVLSSVIALKRYLANWEGLQLSPKNVDGIRRLGVTNIRDGDASM